jgi:hypothetical protein
MRSAPSTSILTAVADLLTLAQAVAAILAIRVLLAALSYPRAAAFLARRGMQPQRPASRVCAQRIARAVRRAARVVPGTTCLVQAHAAAWLLARTGRSAVLYFGVRRDNERLMAHAWLEHDGRIIVGGDARPDYLRLQ